MKSLIIIPDISGFTRFVKNTDIDLGVAITSELLNTILDSNKLPLEVSEIEGDAILFYKTGQPFAPAELFEGLKNIYEAFNTRLKELQSLYNISAELSLKFIVHYGDINVYQVKGFNKLFGQTVIEAHCLLKNGDAQKNYILLTQDYISAFNGFGHNGSGAWAYASSHSAVFAGLRNIDYSYYTYAA